MAQRGRLGRVANETVSVREEFESVQQESSEQIGAVVPSQRNEQTAPLPVPSAPDETLVLPAFVTGRVDTTATSERESKPPEPVRHQAPVDKLPASERGMLIFVAALLGAGTLAMVTVLGVGTFTRPTHHVSNPTKAAVVPVDSTSPSPSPSPVAASASARAAATTVPVTTTPAAPRRSPSPAKVTLGRLTRADPAAFCMDSMAGWPRMQRDGTWACAGSPAHPTFTFTPSDVCQWRYVDKTAYATATDAADPATWTCYT